jgi:hypothetical protein
VGQCAVFGINSLTKDARHKWTFWQVKSNCLETAKTILCLQYALFSLQCLILAISLEVLNLKVWL